MPSPDGAFPGAARTRARGANRERGRLTAVRVMPDDGAGAITYWHRDLPPLDAELLGEHTLEATSSRVPGTLNHRDDLWDRCYRELMASAEERLAQEVGRLGGDYAHVLDEFIDTRRDDVAGEAWLHGRFSYTLYRRQSARD
jgi:hypothetical protein